MGTLADIQTRSELKKARLRLIESVKTSRLKGVRP
jgi:hypothetical protein